MTIQRARELLEDYSLQLSDTEVLELNESTKTMCESLLSIIINDHEKEKNTLTVPDRNARKE